MKITKFVIGTLVLSIGLLGTGYAYWTDEITVRAAVSTGTFNVDFTDDHDEDYDDEYGDDCDDKYETDIDVDVKEEDDDILDDTAIIKVKNIYYKCAKILPINFHNIIA